MTLNTLDSIQHDPPTVRPLPYLEYYNKQFDGRVHIAFYRPLIVCLCGSTKFSREYQTANLRETLAGHIVLTIGCDMRGDAELFAAMDEDKRAGIKLQLDELHLAKIALADEILVLNVGGYIGQSTAREIIEAHILSKNIRYLEPGKLLTYDQLYKKAGMESAYGQISQSE